MLAHAMSSIEDHTPVMERIEVRTFRQILEREYQLACFCPGCRRWATCDLAMLDRNGLGDRDVSRLHPRCRKCGSLGQWQVRGPMADVTPSGHAKAEPIPPPDNVVQLRPSWARYPSNRA
jgi:hypothetical protein